MKLSNVKLLLVAIALAGLSLVGGCNSSIVNQAFMPLNSRYNDQEPALSGDGKWLAFVSNRNGKNGIIIYNLETKTISNLPGLDTRSAISQSPSLSYTGRYIVYISTFQGRPDLILYDRATQSSQFLTKGYRSWLRNPHISPDGRYIVFETARRGQWDIEVLDRGPFVELDLPEGAPIVN